MVFKIGVKFVNQTEYSKTTYYYYMSESDLKANAAVAKRMFLEPTKGHIMTTDGYDYRGSDVIVVSIETQCEPMQTLRYLHYFFDVRPELRATNLLGGAMKAFMFQWFKDNGCIETAAAASSNNCTITIPNTPTTGMSAILTPQTSITGTSAVLTPQICTTGTSGVQTVEITAEDVIDQIITKHYTKHEKESSIMTKLFSNIYFGKAKGLGMSLYGLCECQGDKAFAVNDADEIIDASGMVMMKDCCYLMPTPTNQIKVGDWVQYHGAYYKIITIDPVVPTMFTAICVSTQKVDTLVPAKSPFGFDFMEKVLNPFEGFKWDMTAGGDANAQMNAMLPLMMMSDKGDKKDMMMMMMLMQGQNGMSGMGGMNPMMMMALMGDDDKANVDFPF